MGNWLNPRASIPAAVFLISFVLLSSISLYRYNIVQIFHYDLGIFASIIWQLSQGKLAVINHISLGQINFLGDHFEPSLALLSPLFWIVKDIRILLIEQALATTLSGLIIYLIARKRKLKMSTALIFAIIFFLFAGTVFPLVTDWHPEPTAGFFLLLFIYFFSLQVQRPIRAGGSYTKKKLIPIILAIIFLGFKESNALTLSFFLVSCLFIYKQRRREILFYLIGAFIWFFASIKILIPHFSGREYFYSPQMPSNITEFKQSLFNLEKYEFVWKSFLSFGFLPVLARFGLIPIIGEILLRIAPLHSFFESFTLKMHYNVYLGIFLALAAIDGFVFIVNRLNVRKYSFIIALFFLLPSIFIAKTITYSPLILVTNKVFWQEFRPRSDIYQSLKKVPREGSIASQNNFLPHFIMRKENVMSIQKGYRMKDPEIIVFDLSTGQSPNNFFPQDYNFFLNEKTFLEKSEMYKRIQTENRNIYIFTNKHL